MGLLSTIAPFLVGFALGAVVVGGLLLDRAARAKDLGIAIGRRQGRGAAYGSPRPPKPTGPGPAEPPRPPRHRPVS